MREKKIATLQGRSKEQLRDIHIYMYAHIYIPPYTCIFIDNFTGAPAVGYHAICTLQCGGSIEASIVEYLYSDLN